MRSLLYKWYENEELDRLGIDIYEALSALNLEEGVEVSIVAKENEDSE